MTTALLAVDIGNTAIKVGWFTPLISQRGELPIPDAAVEWPAPNPEVKITHDRLPPQPALWYVSSVNRPAFQAFTDWLSRRRPSDLVRTLAYRDAPLRMDVETPERVGMDRLATAVAADHLRQAHRPAIVIDAGTALKIHLVTEEGAFAGGAILPGFQMASRALAGNTDLLPMVPVSTNIEPPPPIGRNTEEAIRSGLYWGSVGAVRELVSRIRSQRANDPQVFITGGDAGGLASLIDHDTQFVPHLCLAGIALMAQRRERMKNDPFRMTNDE